MSSFPTFPSSIKRAQPAAHILKLSLLISIFFLYTGAYFFPGGAWQFTDYATALASSGTLPARYAQRDAGFPLLLLLSFYPYTGSFVGITLIHTLFAVLIPLLVYGTVGSSYPRVAFWAALAAILSLTPWQFVKFIHHDHAYLFFLVLTCYFAARFVRESRPHLVYCMVFAALACGLTRPAGNWMLIALLIGLALLKPRAWKHYMAGMMIFAASLFIYQQHRLHVFSVKQGEAMPSYTGQQIFYNLYINSAELGVTLSEDLGPNMHALIGKMRTALAPNPREAKPVRDLIQTRNYPEQFRRENFNFTNVDAFVNHFFQHPNYEYYEMLSTIAQDDDRLYLRASGEIARAHPLYVLRYTLRNMRYMLITPGYEHGRDYSGPTQRSGRPYLQPASGAVFQPYYVPARGVHEMEHIPTEHEFAFLAYPKLLKVNIFRIVYTTIKSASILLTALGTLCVVWHYGRRMRRMHSPIDPDIVLIYLLNLGVLLYNALITSALAEPSYRYHYFIIVPQISCAALSMLMLQSLRRPLLTPSYPIVLKWDKISILLLLIILAWPFFLYLSL